MIKNIQTIYSENKKQRVTVFQREDGTFGFSEERFSEDELEMCWLPYSRNVSFFDTLETALHETSSRLDWIINKQNKLDS